MKKSLVTILVVLTTTVLTINQVHAASIWSDEKEVDQVSNDETTTSLSSSSSRVSDVNTDMISSTSLTTARHTSTDGISSLSSSVDKDIGVPAFIVQKNVTLIRSGVSVQQVIQQTALELEHTGCVQGCWEDLINESKSLCSDSDALFYGYKNVNKEKMVKWRLLGAGAVVARDAIFGTLLAIADEKNKTDITAWLLKAENITLSTLNFAMKDCLK